MVGNFGTPGVGHFAGHFAGHFGLMKLVFSHGKENSKQRHHLLAGKLHQGTYLLGPLINGPSKSGSLLAGRV